LHRGPISFGLALAAFVLEYRAFHRNDEVLPLLAPVEVKRSGNAMRQALKISNDEYAAMIGALSFGHLIGETMPGIATIRRFLAGPFSSDARLLMAALAKCGIQRERIEDVLTRFHEFDGADIAPPPLVTGDDLTDAGLKPGPRFKVALDRTYDAQLEGRVATRKEAVEMAIGIAKELMP
jgi:poly(A) polymerase